MNLRRGITAALSAAVLLAACGDDDDNGPSSTGTQFTQAEKTALATAFTNTGLIPGSDDPQSAQLYGLLLGGVQSYGSITIPAALRAGSGSGLRLASVAGEYDATGLQYVFDISVNGETAFRGVSAGLLAWSGLDTQAQTIDDWISIGATDESSTVFPEAVSGVVPDDVDAEYYLASNETLYEGISGNASITRNSFGGSSTNCTLQIPDVGTLNCQYKYGTMEGAFDFVGQPFGVEGENVTFANTDYNIPAVRVTLSGDLVVPVAQVAAVKAGLRRMLRVH